MKKVCLLLGISVFFLISGVEADSTVQISISGNSSENMEIQYLFGDFIRKDVVIDGKTFAEIRLGNESLKKITGSPALPDVSRSLIIPDDSRMEVSVDDSSSYLIKNIDVLPSKGFISRTIDPATVPYSFGTVYKDNSFFPEKLAVLGKPYILRDYRAAVVTVNPFQYNPIQHTLRVYTSMKITVKAVGRGEVNVLSRRSDDGKKVREFQNIYRSHFINYSSENRYSPLDENGEMLIICHDPWIGSLTSFTAHKNSLGIGTRVVGVSTIGNTSTAIKAYIQTIYDDPGTDLAFVLLVGDSDQVASPTYSSGASDPSYSKLAGNDDYPDILVGRFSAENLGELETQLNRTIAYETTAKAGQDWFKKGTGIGSDEGTGDDNEWDWEHIRNIRTDLLNNNYTLVDELYGGSQGGADAPGHPSPADIAQAFNDGRGIVNYCGHGSADSWGWSSAPGWDVFTSTNVDNLTNPGKLPFIVSVACVNGYFRNYTCFAEHWMRATDNGEPAGAIGIYASSINQSWDPPMSAQDEIVDRFVDNSYETLGALCFAGSCQMMDEYGSGGVSMFNTWHLFGDPSLSIVDRTVIQTPTISIWGLLLLVVICSMILRRTIIHHKSARENP